MYKPLWQIYFNNTIAFIIYSVLRLFFRKRKAESNKLLFMNTGQIGDLIVSSVIFTNQELLTKGREVYFLIRERYVELYNDYHGQIRIIPWNYTKYKYNPVYRISFLKKLHSIGFETCINVTAARGVTNDEVALLSGARKVYCLNNNWKYLTKLFGRVMDSHYDNIFSFHTINEPERNVRMVEQLLGTTVNHATEITISTLTEQQTLKKLKEIVNIDEFKKKIAIAPSSDEEFRNWPVEYFKELCSRLVQQRDTMILLLGTEFQKQVNDNIAEVHRGQIINLAGKFSILESAAIVKHANVFIGNDSGFTHIAKALGKKFVGIIGGGCYGLFFPYNVTKNEQLLFHQLDCFGCEWRCHLEKPYCVQNVTVEQVLKCVERFLEQDDGEKIS